MNVNQEPCDAERWGTATVVPFRPESDGDRRYDPCSTATTVCGSR